MNIKTVLIMGLLSLGIGGCSNAQNKQTVQSSQTEITEKADTMENVYNKNTPTQDFWQSGIIINGERIVLPCKLADLEKLGWKLNSGASGEMLRSRNGTTQTDVTNDKGQKLYVSFFNPFSKEVPIREGYIFELTQDLWLHNDNILSFKIAGLKSFEATEDDILREMKKYLTPGFHDTQRMDYEESWDFVDEASYGQNYVTFTISHAKNKFPGKLISFAYTYQGDLLDKDMYKEKYK